MRVKAESISSWQKLVLVVLRFAIGWHFFYQGFGKLISVDWSAEGYLKAGLGPFQKIAENPTLLAIADYTRAIELNPDYAMAYNNRGIAHLQKREYDKAIADYSKAIELDPDYAVAYNDRGIAYRHKGEYDKAIADYTKAIGLDPQWPHAYKNRAGAYKEQGKKAEAIADLKKFITLTDNPQWIQMARQQIEELSK